MDKNYINNNKKSLTTNNKYGIKSIVDKKYPWKKYI
jgi:hypothetical protein